jgi:hypothetical protein
MMLVGSRLPRTWRPWRIAPMWRHFSPAVFWN